MLHQGAGAAPRFAKPRGAGFAIGTGGTSLCGNPFGFTEASRDPGRCFCEARHRPRAQSKLSLKINDKSEGRQGVRFLDKARRDCYFKFSTLISGVLKRDPMGKELNPREKKVLQAIIMDYIQSAEPVGSRTVSKKYKMDLSPATIRNVMADLGGAGASRAASRLGGPHPDRSGVSLLCGQHPGDLQPQPDRSNAHCPRTRGGESWISTRF